MSALKLLKPRLAEINTQRLRPVQATAPNGTPSWRAGQGGANARGYNYRWQQRRKAQLAEEPLCRYCKRQGRIVPATVADHITPHRGDPVLFEGPLQSLCASCHSSAKAKEEQGG
jgi:5-methylcytosine-specific restriction endonuclease McrA